MPRFTVRHRCMARNRSCAVACCKRAELAVRAPGSPFGPEAHTHCPRHARQRRTDLRLFEYIPAREAITRTAAFARPALSTQASRAVFAVSSIAVAVAAGFREGASSARAGPPGCGGACPSAVFVVFRHSACLAPTSRSARGPCCGWPPRAARRRLAAQRQLVLADHRERLHHDCHDRQPDLRRGHGDERNGNARQCRRVDDLGQHRDRAPVCRPDVRTGRVEQPVYARGGPEPWRHDVAL